MYTSAYFRIAGQEEKTHVLVSSESPPEVGRSLDYAGNKFFIRSVEYFCSGEYLHSAAAPTVQLVYVLDKRGI